MTTKKGESYKVKDEPRYAGTLVEPVDYHEGAMSIEIKKVAIEVLTKEVVLRKRPLPQILDEMDDNIRAAAEAARKAEEAARAARDAAVAATKASVQGEKLAEEARIAGIKAAEMATKAAAEAAGKAEAVAKAAKLAAGEAAKKAEEASKTIHTTDTSILKRFKLIEERLAKVEASLLSEKVILLREISREGAKKEIRQLFSEGKTLYYSDIAERLNLDLQLVVKICNELQKRGEIKIDDDTLQSR